MISINAIQATLRELEADLKSRFGIELVGILGSVARGDANADSDLDIAYTIETGKGRTLLDVGGAYVTLRDKLDMEIDMIDWNHVEQRYRRFMERDLIPLHG